MSKLDLHAPGLATSAHRPSCDDTLARTMSKTCEIRDKRVEIARQVSSQPRLLPLAVTPAADSTPTSSTSLVTRASGHVMARLAGLGRTDDQMVNTFVRGDRHYT